MDICDASRMIATSATRRRRLKAAKSAIMDCFSWSQTKEGHKVWQEAYAGLDRLLSTADYVRTTENKTKKKKP